MSVKCVITLTNLQRKNIKIIDNNKLSYKLETNSLTFTDFGPWKIFLWGQCDGSNIQTPNLVKNFKSSICWNRDKNEIFYYWPNFCVRAMRRNWLTNLKTNRAFRIDAKNLNPFKILKFRLTIKKTERQTNRQNFFLLKATTMTTKMSTKHEKIVSQKFFPSKNSILQRPSTWGCRSNVVYKVQST